MTEPKTPDMIWHQDTKILQQIVSLLKNTDNPTLNVVSIGQILENPSIDSKKLLWGYIESLPQPRLSNLVKKVFELALEGHETKVKAAAWLGVTPRVLGYHVKEWKGETGSMSVVLAEKRSDLKKE